MLTDTFSNSFKILEKSVIFAICKISLTNNEYYERII